MRRSLQTDKGRRGKARQDAEGIAVRFSKKQEIEQAGRQAGRQADRQADRQTDAVSLPYFFNLLISGVAGHFIRQRAYRFGLVIRVDLFRVLLPLFTGLEMRVAKGTVVLQSM